MKQDLTTIHTKKIADAKVKTSDEVRENFFKIAALGTQDQFLESMAEAAQAVHNDKQKNGGIIYISVMNNLLLTVTATATLLSQKCTM